MKKVSTTALSKNRGVPTKQLFNQLESTGLVVCEDGQWKLTDAGKDKGGEYKTSPKFGTYIVWPEDLALENPTVENKPSGKVLTSTELGKNFGLSANKVNHLLSELGWVKKYLKGWQVTEQGLKQGGEQKENHKSGVPYVVWAEPITSSKSFKESVSYLSTPTKNDDEVEVSSKSSSQDVSFREKFEAKHRTADGHFVRSKAEMLIDNWLYMAEIVHAYERKLPIEEDVYSDFYIPSGKVYIEYWGYENNEKYLARKKQKIDIYKKYGFNLIELEDKDVQNLDDILPRMLLKYGVQAY